MKTINFIIIGTINLYIIYSAIWTLEVSLEKESTYQLSGYCLITQEDV